MRLTIEGLCPCGGLLRTAEWTTKTHRKGRTTCSACGRTEKREVELEPDPLSDLTPEELEVWNRYARAADQERKDRLEGRRISPAEQEELRDQAARKL